jgi:lipopolysaccharide transport system permease protein
MLAVISTLRATIYTLISIAVMLPVPARLGRRPAVDGAADAAAFVPFMAFLVGMAWFLCAIGAFTRDAGYLMINIVPLFMFATPVFYPHDFAAVAMDF